MVRFHSRANPIMLPLLIAAVVAAPPDIQIKTIEYSSRIDETKPLKADVAMIADGKKKPLLVVMHGYSGSRRDVTLDLKQLAARGVVAIAPDMRGRGGSAGKWDSGGLDVHDILDAVLAVSRKYPNEIDAKNLNIVGYSGGGGNAIACAVRFPDLFRNCVSFFGISDYGGWHQSKGRPDCNRRMETAPGGPPEMLPEIYLARNAIPAAGNCRGKLHLFWDEQEKACPPRMIEDFVAEYRKAGLNQIAVHISKKTDSHRWIHGYRSSNRDLTKADDLFLPDMLAADATAPRLPPSGRLIVPGYLVTRRFQVWIENGQKGQVTVEYDFRRDRPTVRVVTNEKNYRVRIKMKTPLAALPE